MTKYPIDFDIKPLFASSGVPIPQSGVVKLYDRMEIPETNPNDEWIKLGLVVMNLLKKQGFNPNIVADVGTGNGILAIGAAHIFRSSTIYLTDIVEGVLGPSETNLRANIPITYDPVIIKKHGRDAVPLPPSSIDFIVFSPPPLMVHDRKILEQGLARTTLIEYDHYAEHARNADDPMLKWSTLPLYKFLVDAKLKLTPDGRILVLYSGRIPFAAIQEAYDTPDLELEVPMSIVKKQQDPVYLAHYANHERKHLNRDTFDFYNYEQAKRLMQEAGHEMPGLISITDTEIKRILLRARISAEEAYQATLSGRPVAHVGHALLGKLSKKQK